VIGSPVSGRSHVETESLIGFLVNTLAIPVSIDATCDGIELIARAKKSVEEALIDQDLPFERLVDGLGVERSLSQTPVFQAMYIHHSDISNQIVFDTLGANLEPVYLPTAKCDISLYTSVNSGGALQGIFEFDSDLFDVVSVQAWNQALEAFLIAFVKDPSLFVQTLPLTDAAEQQRLKSLSVGLNVDDAEWVSTLPALFHEQFDRYQDHDALIFEDQRINYRELENVQINLLDI